jgi:hypothetical protein
VPVDDTVPARREIFGSRRFLDAGLFHPSRPLGPVPDPQQITHWKIRNYWTKRGVPEKDIIAVILEKRGELCFHWKGPARGQIAHQ